MDATFYQEYERFLDALPLPEIEFCRDCGAPMHVYQQASGIRGRQPITLAECKNRRCDLCDVTLSARQWSQMTSEQLDAYRVVVRGLRRAS